MAAGNSEGPEMREVFVPGDEIMVVSTAERMRQIRFPDSEFLTVKPRMTAETCDAVVGKTRLPQASRSTYPAPRSSIT